VKNWNEYFDILGTGEMVGKSDPAQASLKSFGINCNSPDLGDSWDLPDS